MKTSSLITLLVSAGLLAGTAIYVTKLQKDPIQTLKQDVLLPNVLSQLSGVNRLEMMYKKDKVVLIKSGKTWGVESRYGYKTDEELLHDNFKTLSELKILEPKTSNPAFYGNLMLEAPSEKETSGTRFVLQQVEKDKNPVTVVDLIIGKKTYDSSKASSYVRKTDGKQAFLVEGDLRLPEKAEDWLSKECLDIASKRIERVEYMPKEGASYVLSKADESKVDYTLTPLPEGRKLKNAQIINAASDTLHALNLQDVAKPQDVAFHEKPDSLFKTYDGLLIKAFVGLKDKDQFVRFEFGVDEEILAKKSKEQSAEGKKESSKFNVEAIRLEAKKLQENVAPWAYKFPQYRSARLEANINYFLEAEEKKEEVKAELKNTAPVSQPDPLVIPAP
jgi:hypothetical protein